MRIFLYGPPGSGKSTLGSALAQALSLPFIDLDQEIEAQAGQPIPTLFANEGEAGFRHRERTILESLLDHPTGVFALGGGALLDPNSQARVESAGTVIALSAEPAVLLERLRTAAIVRPLLAGSGAPDEAGMLARLESLLAQRRQHYASFSFQVDTSHLEVEQVVREIQIRLGAFHVSGMGDYDVRVQPGGLETLGHALQQRNLAGPLALVSDENVGRLHAPRLAAALTAAGYDCHTLLIPAGEQHKTLDTVASLWAGFLAAGLERGSTVIALGGGVTGDLAGFAAATYLRGIDWVAVPTSLLAMADASLGGKTGADLPQGKNLIGAFHAPRLVFADPALLATLPEEEARSGLAEVVKAGVIADPTLFERCAQGWQSVNASWDAIIRRTMAVKVQVIQADPYERGQRAALNLGHTIGHAVEHTSAYRIRHGEAVSIGMVAEAHLAYTLGLAAPGLADELARVLSGLGLPVTVPPELDQEVILRSMHSDKKRAGGRVRFALPRSIGEVVVGIEAPRELILQSLSYQPRCDC